MRCEPVDTTLARERAPKPRACVGCGCTDAQACPGGCSWVSLNPPVCSNCIVPDGMDAGAYVEDEAEGDGADNRSGLYGAERCPASATPAPHAEIWVDDVSGYCARCRQGFVT